jgi:hypothetical protein
VESKAKNTVKQTGLTPLFYALMRGCTGAFTGLRPQTAGLDGQAYARPYTPVNACLLAHTHTRRISIFSFQLKKKKQFIFRR